MQLRHYKNLGLEYLLTRTHALATRVNQDDRDRGWSGHYLRDDDSIRAHFQEQLAQCLHPFAAANQAGESTEQKVLVAPSDFEALNQRHELRDQAGSPTQSLGI